MRSERRRSIMRVPGVWTTPDPAYASSKGDLVWERGAPGPWMPLFPHCNRMRLPNYSLATERNTGKGQDKAPLDWYMPKTLAGLNTESRS